MFFCLCMFEVGERLPAMRLRGKEFVCACMFACVLSFLCVRPNQNVYKYNRANFALIRSLSLA